VSSWRSTRRFSVAGNLNANPEVTNAKHLSYEVRKCKTAMSQVGIMRDANAAMNAEVSVLNLLPKVYDELRRIAATQMARRPAGCTLQPTALVHEAWIRLGGCEQPEWQNRAHFFAAAAEAMRNVLIDRARSRRASKHGGGQTRVSVEDMELAAEVRDEDSLLALSAAIDRLSHEHAEMAQLVKLRCFAGLEVNQAALALGVSRATANRWWLFARTWLYRELHQ